MIGALARHTISAAFPHAAGSFDWATLAVNAAGCALIGMLMVAFTEVWRPHRLALPFLGVVVLGGFTTFSVYVIDVQHALAAEPFAASAPGAGRRR
jgi:CrcB protein